MLMKFNFVILFQNSNLKGGTFIFIFMEDHFFSSSTGSKQIEPTERVL